MTMNGLASLFWTTFEIKKIKYVPKLIFYEILKYASVKTLSTYHKNHNEILITIEKTKAGQRVK